jgi:hypothetical protein
MQISREKNNLFLKFQKVNLEIKQRKRVMEEKRKDYEGKIRNNYLK